MAKSYSPRRETAEVSGEFVVFLVGMRINRLWAVGKWLPQVRAMVSMITELRADSESGFLGAQAWFGRTILVLQYWRSIDHLLAYANSPELRHRPAWQAFFKGTDGSAGFWHETYIASPGSYETIYVDMPPFGLGAVGHLVPADGSRKKAADRIKRNSEP